MTKLKTLKDIEFGKDFYHLRRNIANSKDLKEEAIKWIKSKIDRIMELQKSDEPYKEEWISQNQAVILAFSKFFNIKDGDVK